MKPLRVRFHRSIEHVENDCDGCAAMSAEAVTAALTALRAQVEELPGYPDGLRPGSVRRTAVLAAIDAAALGEEGR